VGRFRGLISGPASALLVLLMLAGCLTLWIGVPLAWLWIGSQIQASASLGTALLATMAGILASTVILMMGLSWLNRQHAALRGSPRSGAAGARRGRALRRGEPAGALEPILVASAGIAVAAFAIWFFGFSGASPIPLNLGY
jgi:hypothetical protein